MLLLPLRRNVEFKIAAVPIRMCITFFCFGNEKFPLLLCNNRDEYFRRPTAPGVVSKDNLHTYSPTDIVAGGTWLGLNGKNGRFGVLLNFLEKQIHQESNGNAVEGNFYCFKK